MSKHVIEMQNKIFDVEFVTKKAPELIQRALSTEGGVKWVLDSLSGILVNIDKSNIEEYNKGASWCIVSIKEDK